MKKIVVVLVAVAFIASSCSTYTCPTYTKKPVENREGIKETKI